MNLPSKEVFMDAYDNSQSDHFKSVLERRVAELRAVLRETGELRESAQGEPREVVDFKDLAGEQELASLQDIKAEHAAEELSMALAALRRLAEGSYGECLDCGVPIDVRRLEALPATPYCTACQSIHEHDRPASARH
jgi:DnaK suppressor protein